VRNRSLVDASQCVATDERTPPSWMAAICDE
jgi:hypothetical protein